MKEVFRNGGNKKYKALVINFFGGMGDAILSIPFLQSLSRMSCEIHLLTHPSYPIKSIALKIPYIKETLIHHLVSSEFRYGYLGTLVQDIPTDIRFMWKLNKKGPFDFIFWIEYPLREPKRTGAYKYLLLSLVKASWKACLTRGRIDRFPGIKIFQVDHFRFFPVQINQLLPPALRENDVERADLSFLLGKTSSPLIEGLSSSYPLIILHPFCYNSPFMRIPISKWEAVIKQVRESKSTSEIVLLGTTKDFSSESERLLWEEICRKYGIHNLIDKTSIEDIAHLVNRCSLFIGHDSGLSHFAWAFDKPRLIIYRCPSPHSPSVYYREENKLHLFLPQVKCFPCGGENALSCESKACMNSYDWLAISSTLGDLLNGI